MAKNIKELLLDATKFPAAIEARLPAGAPPISATLVDITGRIPVVPDFPVEIPELPAPPELPELPAMPGAGGPAGLRRYVTGVRAIPVTGSPIEQVVIPSPFVGVVPEVITRRGM